MKEMDLTNEFYNIFHKYLFLIFCFKHSRKFKQKDKIN